MSLKVTEQLVEKVAQRMASKVSPKRRSKSHYDRERALDICRLEARKALVVFEALYEVLSEEKNGQ